LEPEVRAYLVRILNTISVSVLWLIICTTAGIQFDYAFINETISIGNIVYYIWLVLSLGLYIWYLIRLWSKPLNIPE